MLTFDTYHTHLAKHLTMLRAACTTEASIGTSDDGVSCFFMLTGGTCRAARPALAPSSRSFGAAAPLLMVDLEATAEADTVEETVMGGLPDRLNKAINRRVANSIIAALDDCPAVLPPLQVSQSVSETVVKSLVALGENEVPVEDEDQMFALGTPALRNRVLNEPRSGAGMVKLGGHEFLHWAGLNWMFSPVLRGVGTSQEQCYIFHRHAIGHALDLVALAAPGAVTGGIDPKTGRGWMKAKTKQLATVLQSTGVVRLIHDGTR